ncbi:hypothetical protein [Gallaecimonas sp. GXIMD4217]|uniref:hypothetical protein n=1 Tax=Gallaecimonas sp. GXIMD4217 TaxID=3131927 RepID=UPI00311AD1E5
MTVGRVKEWSVNQAETPDTLLDCLLWILARDGRPLSQQALTAGVPLGDAGLSPEFLPGVAARAGYRTRLLRLSVSGLRRYPMPQILLLS